MTNREQPMFEFEGSQVDKLSDNETDSGSMVKDKGSTFKEISGNRRGQKKESIKAKLKWEIFKSPIPIAVGVIIALIVSLISL